MSGGSWDTPFSLGDVEVIASTDAAILVEIEGDEVWVPESCIHDDSEIFDPVMKGDIGELVVRLWWAERSGYA